MFVDIDPQPAVIGPLAALDETDEVVHPERGTNLAQSFPVNDTPELEAAFEAPPTWSAVGSSSRERPVSRWKAEA